MTIRDPGTGANVVFDDMIGLSDSGGVAIPNQGNGVLIQDATENEVGDDSTSSVTGNVIASNGGAGVGITGSTATFNLIFNNRIFNNAGLGIDLGLDGVTPNAQRRSPGGRIT